MSGARRSVRAPAGRGEDGLAVDFEAHRSPLRNLLRGAQRLFEVGDDVGSRLEADRQPDQVLANSGGGELLGVHLLMGGRSGMDHQRFCVANVGQDDWRALAPR